MSASQIPEAYISKSQNVAEFDTGTSIKIRTTFIEGISNFTLDFHTVNIKWEDLLWVTKCSLQNFHIDILNFTIFVPVPNSGAYISKAQNEYEFGTATCKKN